MSWGDGLCPGGWWLLAWEHCASLTDSAKPPGGVALEAPKNRGAHSPIPKFFLKSFLT